MSDAWELEYGLNPLDSSDAGLDFDSDGVLNKFEYTNHTNPLAQDSDLDEIPDLWEIINGLDPMFDDALEDPDQDAVSNLDEYREGTDPQFAELRLERYVLPISAIGIVVVLTVSYIIRRRN
jgi:hypothetical protein